MFKAERSCWGDHTADVTGKLKDEFGGTPIEGTDCVRVLKAVLKDNKDNKDNKDSKGNKEKKNKMK